MNRRMIALLGGVAAMAGTVAFAGTAEAASTPCSAEAKACVQRSSNTAWLTDGAGNVQPTEQVWNVEGMSNTSVQRVTVHVTEA